jgi:3-hexulose-6-phosphate synthase
MILNSKPLLQVAIDVLNIRAALRILDEVYPFVDIVEVGTPLIIEEGLAALEALKARYPEKKYLADLKIMDAGTIEASSGFSRGADIVTVLATADDRTIRAAVEVAKVSGGQIMADMINVSDPAKRAKELEMLRVPIICLHTAFDCPGSVEHTMNQLRIVRPTVHCQLAVAGGLTLETVQTVASLAVDILVVGSAITNQPNPHDAACLISKKLEEWRSCAR